MNKYAYDGPVMIFDTCVTSKWKGETCAGTEAKARTNLTYQYKKQNNLQACTRVTLTGKLVQIY